MKNNIIYLIPLFLFFPLISMERALVKEDTSKIVERVRRSTRMIAPQFSPDEFSMFAEYVKLNDSQVQAPDKIDVNILLTKTIDQTKLVKDPALRTAGTMSALGSIPVTVEIVRSKPADIATICRLVQEDEIENFKKFLSPLPDNVKADFKNIHDEKSRPLLFLALANKSLGMVQILVESLHVPINELFKEKPTSEPKTALDLVREMKSSFREYIEKYLLEHGARSYQSMYSELLSNKLHPEVATKLLRYIKANETGKFKKLIQEIWPKKSPKEIKEILSKIQDVNGYSLLFVAAAADSPDIVIALIEYGMFVNEVCNGITVLDYLNRLDKRYSDLIRKKLFDTGARSAKDLVAHEKFQAAPHAIYRPIEWEEAHFVHMIDSRKTLATVNIAQLMQRNLETGTFLAVAAQKGRADLVERLCEKFNAPIDFLHESKTSLDYAQGEQTEGHKQAVAYLQRKGAKSGRAVIDSLMKHFEYDKSDIREAAKGICTSSLAVLFLSAALGKIRLIKSPHSVIALNMFNKEGETPFDVALRFGDFRAAYEIQIRGGKRSHQVEAIEKLVPDSLFINNLEIYGAVLADDLAAVEKLVNPTTNINNLLAFACHCNKPRIMRFLVEQWKANVNFAHDNGETVLDMAHDNPEIRNYLRDKGAKPKEQFIAI